MTIRIGLSAYNIAGNDLVELCRAADELGFASLWLGEHIVLPLDYGSEHPTSGTTTHEHHRGPIIDPATILVDPLVALSAAAAVTTHIHLATGIYLLPLRHPLITARMVATIHDVSGGRFMLGVGSGWLEEEFTALGVAFGSRKERYVEAIEILRAAWTGEPFEHRGKEFKFGRVQIGPDRTIVPLILGGNTEPALRRAASLGDGWFASGTPSFDDAVRLRDRVMVLRSESAVAGPFSIHVRKANAGVDDLPRYESEGIENVLVWADQVWPHGVTLGEKRAALKSAADRLGVERNWQPIAGPAPAIVHAK